MHDLTIEDIAHSLSNICRFGGHCKHFYSVAQHAYHVSHLCKDGFALEGLMHDNTEGLGLMDIPRPIKYAPGMEVYRSYEAALSDKLDAKFDLNPMHDGVKAADDQMLVAEMAAFNLGGYQYYSDKLKEKGITEIKMEIEAWEPKKAERKFLKRYYALVKLREPVGEEEAVEC